jgi:hypothetical protein
MRCSKAVLESRRQHHTVCSSWRSWSGVGVRVYGAAWPRRSLTAHARWCSWRLCASIERCMVSWLPLPAVLMKDERVHRDGRRRRGEHPSRNRGERRPCIRRGRAVGQGEGWARRTRGTWSGCTARRMICQWCAAGHRMEKRYQSVMHRALQPLAPPLGALDEVVHHQVDTVLLVWKVQGDRPGRSSTTWQH